MNCNLLSILLVLVLLVILMPGSDGRCLGEKLMNSRTPYARRTLLEIGRERPPYGEDVFAGPGYSWGRQSVMTEYIPSIVPYADTARATGAQIRPINNSNMEMRMRGEIN